MQAIDPLPPKHAGKPVGCDGIAEAQRPRCVRDAHQQNATAAECDTGAAQHFVLCAGIEIVQNVEQHNDVGRGVALAANVAADEARAPVERAPCTIDVAMPSVDADVGDRVGRRWQRWRPGVAAVARRFEQRRQQALAAAEIQDAAAVRDEPVRENMCERWIPCELAECEVPRESAGAAVASRGVPGERSEERVDQTASCSATGCNPCDFTRSRTRGSASSTTGEPDDVRAA